MRKTSEVLFISIAIAQVATLGARAADYVLDNGSRYYGLNASDVAEPRDNWFGNAFTALAGGNLITRVDFGVAMSTANMKASVVFYRITDPGGDPALGATRVYTQAFTPVVHTGGGAASGYALQKIPLTTPVLFKPGDRFLVAVFMPNVIAAKPNDVYPYTVDTSEVSTDSYWDRSDPNTFNLDDLSQALPEDQFVPGHIILRAHGIDATPVVLSPALNGANLEASFASQIGTTYQLQSTTNLGDLHPVWTNEGSPMPGTGITITVTMHVVGTAKFLRIWAQ